MDVELSPAAYALLEVVHDFGSAGTGTDTAATDLSKGPPWFGLEPLARELERAGLITIDPGMADAGVPRDPEPQAQVLFLVITAAGRALLGERREP
jgi:hypothetical protein